MMRISVFYLMTGLCFILFISFPQKGEAQRPHDSTHLDSLRVYEKELEQLGDSMIDGSTQGVRVHNLKQYIPTLVDALSIPGSFDYNFDSLRYMFTFTPPDKKFRLYNWHIEFVNNTFRFYGVIQMNNKDSLELYPLYDRVEDALLNAEDTVLRSNGWYGAQYFKLIQKTIDSQKHYILLGWDGFNQMANRKLIDVLTFGQDGKPRFGAPIFKEDGRMKKRIMYIYNDDATMQLDYNSHKDIIAYDNLVPPNKRSKGAQHTYIPDGTYSYFVYMPEKGYWQQKSSYFRGGKTPAEEPGK